MSFFSFLESRTYSANSLLCIGLDPHIDDLASPNAEAAYEFCMRLIDSTTIYASAYKPNMAFFELFGADGFIVLKRIIDTIPDDIPVILDAKRGDIASTAQAYAQSAFQVLNADAVTLSPYLGLDSVEPFIKDPELGVFLLCKTSNPGASDLQDVMTLSPDDSSKKTVYERVASLAVRWDRNGNIGLVVGSTQPESMVRVREIAPDMWFLAPGVGAQGADLRTALDAGLRKDKSGMLIPISRGISRADDPGKAADEIRQTINKLRQTIHQRSKIRKIISKDDKYQLADTLLEKGCIKFADGDNQFILKSGLKSPIYIDLRRLVAFPELVRTVASAYLPILSQLDFDRLAALPYAAIPIATAISLVGNWPMIYPRKEVKQYGTKAEIEGEYFPDERVVIIDDLATTGGSKFEAIDKLTNAHLVVKDVVVLIDRQSGAAEELGRRGYQLHAVFTLGELLDHWETTRTIPDEQIILARDFLKKPPD